MKPIKLAFVTQFPIDINRPLGGVEAVSVNLLRSLSAYAELDIQVVTLCPNITQVTQESWERVTVHRLPKPRGSELINAITKSKALVADYVRKLQPDLIHAHDTYGIMVNDLAIPKVFTVHGFIYGDTLFANGRFKWLRSKLWEYIEKRSWAKQPNIISISPYVRENVSSVTSANIYDIDNPISDKFFVLERNEKVGTIFTSAVICPRKNSLLLVKAVGLLVAAGYNVQLRIAGSVGDERYAQEQQRWILENNLEKHVHLLGRISTEDVMKELSSASIYALTSLEENSPMGIEEAMAVGVPVVTSNRCGMPYMVKHSETGYLVNPFDENNIADKFKKILGNSELQLAMSIKSKALALDLYHSDNVARRTYAVYRELQSNAKS
ncbi:glycosyl transferase, group 1 [Psychromonas ingrahamii 37]|uniref:Glycosyl transferase, group 1 n=1 Tax=Psychromonas ingrahamii (strain DSM 17664 / CCUG 51855 / 37) TaxID=357804 RepID=A1SS50_PSYIN|nr:glycosyltransferase family 4 protein [Psychromonas ingrahamii]ABM02315.1 glycosyl transferase, group 1 [Psychromonas ingrahamii 37]